MINTIFYLEKNGDERIFKAAIPYILRSGETVLIENELYDISASSTCVIKDGFFNHIEIQAEFVGIASNIK